jgi:hypothetical protein
MSLWTRKGLWPEKFREPLNNKFPQNIKSISKYLDIAGNVVMFNFTS